MLREGKGALRDASEEFFDLIKWPAHDRNRLTQSVRNIWSMAKFATGLHC